MDEELEALCLRAFNKLKDKHGIHPKLRNPLCELVEAYIRTAHEQGRRTGAEQEARKYA